MGEASDDFIFLNQHPGGVDDVVGVFFPLLFPCSKLFLPLIPPQTSIFLFCALP